MGLMIGAVVGGLLGYGFYRWVGCKAGGCPLASKPWANILYGILAGSFLVYSSGSGIGCSKNSDEPSNPYVMKFTSDNWEKDVLQSKKPVLVDFWAPWCGPCRFQGPIVDKLAEQYKDSVVTGKLNVDNNGKIAGQYGIRNIPTLIVFKDGKILDQFTGVTSPDTIEAALKKAGGK